MKKSPYNKSGAVLTVSPWLVFSLQKNINNRIIFHNLYSTAVCCANSIVKNHQPIRVTFAA